MSPAGPTIWLDGRVVGGWIQRRDGEIAYRLLEDVGRAAAALIEARAADLRTWLGDLRFIPRFRTALEQDLIAGSSPASPAVRRRLSLRWDRQSTANDQSGGAQGRCCSG